MKHTCSRKQIGTQRSMKIEGLNAQIPIVPNPDISGVLGSLQGTCNS